MNRIVAIAAMWLAGDTQLVMRSGFSFLVNLGVAAGWVLVGWGIILIVMATRSGHQHRASRLISPRAPGWAASCSVLSADAGREVWAY